MDIFRNTHPRWGFLLIALLASLLILLMAIPKTWEEATKIADDGSITLADDWAGTVERKVSKYERNDLYMLVAARDGYFLCRHCPTQKFFLKKGEIYKYGTTGDGQSGRGYNEQWLNNHSLSYIRLMSADLTTVKSAEAGLIGNYPLLPENRNRPLVGSKAAKTYWYRLVLPVGNNGLD